MMMPSNPEETMMSDESEQFDAIFGAAPPIEAEAPEVVEEALPEEEVADVPLEEEEQPEPESAPELPAAAKAPEAPKAQDTVPLAVFLDMKQELRELKRELEASRKPPAPPPEPAGPPVFQPTVSYDDDPAQFLREQVAYVEALAKHQGQDVAQARAIAEAQIQQQRQQQAMSQFAGAVSSAEEQFRTQATDYDDAVEFMRSSRAAEVKAVADANGWAWDEQQAHQSITREFAQLAAAAMQNGRNPASVLYTLAKARGFTAPAKASTSTVERLERGVAASRSSQAVAGRTANTSDGESSGNFFKDLQRSAGYRS